LEAERGKENMEKLQRDMMKSKGQTMVLSTGLKDKNAASDMMDDVEVREKMRKWLILAFEVL
jgi:hypothetical protein